ncbi:MAG TPA: tape measure protein, partial [Jiangellaceae bacterium]|nr:tape measure protein [Jiangellaceae bacterium]
MAIVGRAQVLVAPVFSGLQKDIRKELEGAGGDAGEVGGRSLGDSLSKWGKRGAAVAGTAIAAVTGTALVKGFGRLQAIENAQAKMRGLGHDAETVRQIMDNALTSVRGTAFGLGEAATIAASAVAAGIEPGEKLAGHLTNVANTAAAAGVSMEEMGSIFNRAATQANGVQNDVISQLADRGIPIYQALADQMGVTAGEVFKLASQGKVDFETFSAAAQEAAGTV